MSLSRMNEAVYVICCAPLRVKGCGAKVLLLPMPSIKCKFHGCLTELTPLNAANPNCLYSLLLLCRYVARSVVTHHGKVPRPWTSGHMLGPRTPVEEILRSRALHCHTFNLHAAIPCQPTGVFIHGSL